MALSAAALAALGGCETQKIPQAVGGSKSDATVKLSFDYGMFEKPVIDWAQADASANDRCHVWGYAGAERFDAGLRECSEESRQGCYEWRVVVTYQCTGASHNG